MSCDQEAVVSDTAFNRRWVSVHALPNELRCGGASSNPGYVLLALWFAFMHSMVLGLPLCHPRAYPTSLFTFFAGGIVVVGLRLKAWGGRRLELASCWATWVTSTGYTLAMIDDCNLCHRKPDSCCQHHTLPNRYLRGIPLWVYHPKASYSIDRCDVCIAAPFLPKRHNLLRSSYTWSMCEDSPAPPWILNYIQYCCKQRMRCYRYRRHFHQLRSLWLEHHRQLRRSKSWSCYMTHKIPFCQLWILRCTRSQSNYGTDST